MKFGALIALGMLVAACAQSFGPMPLTGEYFETEADARAAGYSEFQIVVTKRWMRRGVRSVETSSIGGNVGNGPGTVPAASAPSPSAPSASGGATCCNSDGSAIGGDGWVGRPGGGGSIVDR